MGKIIKLSQNYDKQDYVHLENTAVIKDSKKLKNQQIISDNIQTSFESLMLPQEMPPEKFYTSITHEINLIASADDRYILDLDFSLLTDFTGIMVFPRLDHDGKPTGYTETLNFKDGYIDIDATNLLLETYNAKTGYSSLPECILDYITNVLILELNVNKKSNVINISKSNVLK